MRDKIIEMIKHYDQIDWNISCVGPSEYLEVLADQILALLQEEDLFHTGLAQGYKQGQNDCIQLPSLEGIEHVEECPYAHPFREEFLVPCLKCNGTGTITRQAEWGDIDVKAMIRDILFTKNYFPSLSTKSGGRLRMKK